MGILTETPNYTISTPKGKIKVNPAFDVVLEVSKLYKEEELSNLEKAGQAFDMLVVNKWNARLFTAAEKVMLLEKISKNYIKDVQRPKVKTSPVPLLDFDLDGDYIYASFMQDYGIDLISQQGKLPWKKFIWLFNGLGSDTKIKQVMRIRDMEIPKSNGKNHKEIQDIMELKSYYALPVKGGGGQKGLDLLFSTLEGMAKR